MNPSREFHAHVRWMFYAIAFSIFLLTSSLVVLNQTGCNSCPVGPKPGPDTTSHAFTWTVTTLGDGAGSSLYDVAIINDTLAYAVGEMYLAGETDAYNLARWNGSTWHLLRLQFYTFPPDTTMTGSYPADAVFAFSPADVRICCGSQITRFDGSRQLTTASIPVSVRRLWGSSPSNIYAAGAAGRIAHFDGTTWTKIESGTTLDVRGVWGMGSPSGSIVGQVLAIASTDTDSRLIGLTGTSASFLPDSGLSHFLHGIWFAPGTPYYIVGAGIHCKKDLRDNLWQHYPSGVVTSYMSNGIRGQGANDVVVVGSFCEIVHFNGVTWQNYIGELYSSNGVFAGVDFKGNTVIAVGTQGQQALIAVGRR